MPIDVSTPVGGPAYLTFDSVTYQMRADWKLTEVIATGEVTTNLQGVLEVRDETVMIKIAFTPLAVWGNLTKLFPYARTSIGNLIRTGTDLPVVVQTKAGKAITFTAGALTKSPALNLTSDPKKSIFGEMEITCLVKTNSAPTASDAFVAVTTSAYTEPTLTPATILSPKFTTIWGDGSPAAPFNGIETEDGVLFQAEYGFEPVVIDTVGLINMRVTKVEAKVEFTPVNMTEANLETTFNILNTGRGVRRPSGLFSCIGAASGDPSLTLACAQAIPGGMRFGKGGRVDKLSLVAAQKATVGVLQPLWVLTTV